MVRFEDYYYSYCSADYCYDFYNYFDDSYYNYTDYCYHIKYLFILNINIYTYVK